MRWLVPIIIVAPLWGASIAGQPQPPTPGPMPTVWGSFQDDLLGDAVLNADDYRTGGLRLNGRCDLGDGDWTRHVGVVVAVDYSVLTDRGYNVLPEGRCDELTASVGLAWDRLDRGRGVLRPLLIVSGGGRWSENLGGQTLQNQIHRTFHYNRVHLPYEYEQSFAWQGNAYGRLVWDAWTTDLGSFGLALDGGGLVSSAHEHQAFAGLRGLMLGREGLAWIGGRHQWHGVDTQAPTAHAVAEHEKGWWIDAGLGIGSLGTSLGLWVDGAVNPTTKAIDGSVGMIWGMGSSSRSTRDPVPVEATFIGQWSGGGMATHLGVPLRYGTTCLHLAPVLDYRHGDVAGHEAVGNAFGVNQFTFGMEPSVRCRWPWSRLMIGAYGHVDGGVRVEAVAEREQPARFPRKTATRGVCTSGLGIMTAVLCTGDRPEDDQASATRGMVGLRFGYDWWWPWDDAEIADAAGVERLQTAGGSWILGLGFTVGW